AQARCHSARRRIHWGKRSGRTFGHVGREDKQVSIGIPNMRDRVRRLTDGLPVDQTNRVDVYRPGDRIVAQRTVPVVRVPPSTVVESFIRKPVDKKQGTVRRRIVKRRGSLRKLPADFDKSIGLGLGGVVYID